LLIRDKIAEEEGITVSDADIDSAINALRSAGKEGLERVRKIEHDEEELDHLKRELMDQKVLNFLAKNVKMKETKVNQNKEVELVT